MHRLLYYAAQGIMSRPAGSSSHHDLDCGAVLVELGIALSLLLFAFLGALAYSSEFAQRAAMLEASRAGRARSGALSGL